MDQGAAALPGEAEAGLLFPAQLLPHYLRKLPYAELSVRDARNRRRPHHVLDRLAVRERRPRGDLVRRLRHQRSRSPEDRPRQRGAALQTEFRTKYVIISAGATAFLAETEFSQLQELAARLRPVGEEVRIALLGCLALGRRHAVDLGAVQAEDLRPEPRRHFRVAVFVAQLSADLESAEGLDLVLRRAVPDRVGAPEHVVLAAVLDELAKRVRRVFGVAHEEAPGAAELRVDVGVRRDAVLDERAHQRVDAVALRRGIVGLLLHAGDEARVVDQELDVRKALRHDADIAALAVLVGLRAEGQALVHAHHLHAERARLLDETGAHIVR